MKNCLYYFWDVLVSNLHLQYILSPFPKRLQRNANIFAQNPNISPTAVVVQLLSRCPSALMMPLGSLEKQVEVRSYLKQISLMQSCAFTTIMTSLHS